MRLLAIDTSTAWGGAALLEADAAGVRLIAEAGLHVQDSLAARMLPLIESLVLAVGWRRTDIDVYVAARGPGSFTGIRVGLGILEGLGIASGRPCVGVGTLEAVAEAFGAAEADRIPLVPAGRGNLYGARFDALSSPPRLLAAPWVGPVSRAFEGSGPAVIFGPRGLLDRVATAPPGVSARIAIAPTSIAAGAGRIAASRVASGLTLEDAPTPLYVRPSYAEAAPR